MIATAIVIMAIATAGIIWRVFVVINQAAYLRERSHDMHLEVAKYYLRNRNRSTEVPEDN